MGDELLDVVDANDNVLSQAMRSAVHREGFYHRGIHVFLATPEGKLLVQQRSESRESFPMALDCSVSEHVKAGETYLAGSEARPGGRTGPGESADPGANQIQNELRGKRQRNLPDI